MGYFDVENTIIPDSKNIFCNDCYYVFGVNVNRMHALQDPNQIRENFAQARQKIQASSLKNKEMLYDELERLFTIRFEQSDPDIAAIRAAEELARLEQEKQEEAVKKRAMAQMLITSGFQFDGYRITKYSGYISGDDAIQISRGTDAGWFGGATDVGAALMSSLAKIRRNALQELKEAAYELGCNAVIGVDFDYLTLDPQTANFRGGTTYLPYVFGVTANGNAVIIEKIEESEYIQAEQEGHRRRRNTLTAEDLL